MGATAENWILSRPWAMLPEMVETIVSIARRNNDIEAVIAKRGEPLDNTRNVQVRDGVAIIPVRGPISRYAGMFDDISGATSIDILARDFKASLESPDVKAIVLEIDSPGGQAAGIGEMAGMIRKGAALKPVTAYVSNLGASAALWVASAASRVVIAPSALMGSMGVVWPVGRQSKEDKESVLEFVSSQSPNKRPDIETKEGRAQMQSVVDAMAEVFIKDVATYRNLDPAKAIKQFGKGGLLVGQAAVDAGMADCVGTLEGCLEDLSKPKKSTSMKINFGRLITGLMSRGITESVEASTLDEVIKASQDDSSIENIVIDEIREEIEPMAAETNHSEAVAAAIATAKAEMLAELRAGRVELYKGQAEAFLSLNTSKYLPAEKHNLASAFVAASLIDAESPVEGFSVLTGFRESLKSRPDHGHSAEMVTGDAKTIADHLSEKALKTLDSAATNPDDAKAAKDAAEFEKMLSATESGRKILAEMAAAK